jgi:lipid-binding SYLF domain-containing protein
MKTLISMTTTLLLAGLVISGQAAAQEAKYRKIQGDVEEAIKAFKKADPGLEQTFTNAAGYAVFPNVGKGGLVFGGAHGLGYVYEADKLIGYASLTQVTFGAQIGGQEFSQVVFFETKAALEKFKQSQFTMNAQVSAVAAAEGASKNAKYVEGVMVFTHAKQGLMAEASVGGQKFKFTPAVK